MTAKRPDPKADRALTRELAAGSLKRILCQFPVGSNTKDYFEAIFEAARLAEIPDDVFEGACLCLASTMLPYKPPVASEYLEAARRIRAASSRRREDCKLCLGRGLHLIQIFDRHSEKMVDAYTPCRECAPIASA